MTEADGRKFMLVRVAGEENMETEALRAFLVKYAGYAFNPLEIEVRLSRQLKNGETEFLVGPIPESKHEEPSAA